MTEKFASNLFVPTLFSELLLCGRDFCQSFARSDLWLKLAWRDVRVLFERSFIGPLWMTIQAALWTIAIVFVFGGIIAPVKEYVVYVAAGIVLYNFITVIATDSSEIFIKHRIIIHSHPNPYFAYILRHIGFSGIQLLFQSIVVAVAMVWAQHTLSLTALWAIPGIVLCVIMGVFTSLLFALIGLRWGDFRFAMLAIMRLGLFVTPILWYPDNGGALKKVAAQINPISHFVDVVRQPLLGSVPSTLNYVVVFTAIAIACFGSIWMFAKFRRTIPMWV